MTHTHWKTGQPCNCGFTTHLKRRGQKFITSAEQHEKRKRLYHAKTILKKGAADPEWLQDWMEKNGPYLYHGTKDDLTARKIAEEGLYPHDDLGTGEPDQLVCPNCGYETPFVESSVNRWGAPYEGDPCPHCGDDDLRRQPNWSNSKYAGQYFEPRLGHTYLGTKDYSNQYVNRLNGGLVRVDLRKLDPSHMNADEDHFSPGVGNVNEEHPAVQRALGLRPPDPHNWMPGARTLGSWADQIQLGRDPNETHYSLEKGSMAYNGRVPPEAIEQVNEAGHPTGHTFSSVWKAAETDDEPFEAQMWHGSERGLLGPVRTPFMATDHKPEAQGMGPAVHPVSVRFHEPMHYFGELPSDWYEHAQAVGHDGVVLHLFDPERQQAIALDPGTVTPSHGPFGPSDSD